MKLPWIFRVPHTSISVVDDSAVAVIPRRGRFCTMKELKAIHVHF